MGEYYRNYYYARKIEYINLLGGKCVKCGATENLEFDHIDPTEKTFSITKFLNYSKALALEELKKCQLLCYSCHKLKTNGTRQHGTTRMYRVGCRCTKCSKANTECVRKWRVGQRSATPS